MTNSDLNVLLLDCCAVQSLCHHRRQLGHTGVRRTEWQNRSDGESPEPPLAYVLCTSLWWE
eukprot:2983595-Amphidinium_carterae.1